MLVLDTSEEPVAHGGHGSGASDKEAPFPVSVGKTGRGNADQIGGKVRRCRQPLGTDTVEAHVPDDGGQKVGQGGEGEVGAKVHESVSIVLVVGQGCRDLRPTDASLRRRVGEAQALDGKHSLVVGEKRCLVRRVDEKEVDDG